MHDHDKVLTDVSRCTIDLADGSRCGQPSAPAMPFPICGRHAAKLYRHLVKLMGELDSQPLFRLQMCVDMIEDRAVKQQQQVAERPLVVYYVQVGNLIKIGYTGRLRQRMAQYPPNSQLLATEPGNHVLEQKRHQQFAELLVHGNEWFRPGAALLDHVNTLRKPASRR